MKVLKTINIPFLGKKVQGKVRDIYKKDKQRILITTDRISAFDRVLGQIPLKGQVLNQLSKFWFQQTSDIVDNHMICALFYNNTVLYLDGTEKFMPLGCRPGEFFVSEFAAKEGLIFKNMSETEPIVMLKHFGPGNPDLKL